MLGLRQTVSCGTSGAFCDLYCEKVGQGKTSTYPLRMLPPAHAIQMRHSADWRSFSMESSFLSKLQTETPRLVRWLVGGTSAGQLKPAPDSPQITFNTVDKRKCPLRGEIRLQQLSVSQTMVHFKKTKVFVSRLLGFQQRFESNYLPSHFHRETRSKPAGSTDTAIMLSETFVKKNRAMRWICLNTLGRLGLHP